jgi:4-hydroxyproline epimerase
MCLEAAYSDAYKIRGMTTTRPLPLRLSVIDSHTAGEPTRVLLSAGLDLGSGELAERLSAFRERYDGRRAGVVTEPRGSEVVVGALLCEPVDPANTAGVIFFNDVGYLGMCGHGTIGVVTTLAHLGRITPGRHGIETPVGTVQTELHEDGGVSVENVPSYRYRQDVAVDVAGHGRVTGDVAWGGNWFFLTRANGVTLEPSNRVELIAYTTAIRRALTASGVTGEGGAPIDHVELSAAPNDPANSSRNFVLCPGASFDRSPCGTGTSAKMACEYAAGRLQPGQLWRQEGILGTVFAGTIAAIPGSPGWVLPTVSGRAWITAESTLIFDPGDPFREGIKF